MKVTATAKFIGTSSRKLGLVAAAIRGQNARTAQITLLHIGKRAGTPLGKVLGSAIANAENNYRLESSTLTIESIFVGPGPTLKRFRPRAKGAAGSIKKRSSHITVVLNDNAAVIAKAPQQAEVAAPKSAKVTTTKEAK